MALSLPVTSHAAPSEFPQTLESAIIIGGEEQPLVKLTQRWAEDQGFKGGIPSVTYNAEES